MLDLKNRKFCLDLSFPSTSVYFSGPAGSRSLLARLYYMTRRAVLPKSNTGTGTLGRIQTTYRFCTLAVFNLEFLEICEFVCANRIFLQVFSVFPFDPCDQIAKRIWNEGCDLQQRVVSCDSKISKIENFMKSWSWWAVRRLKSDKFSRWRDFNALRRLRIVLLHDS